jgi:hypothetical protein
MGTTDRFIVDTDAAITDSYLGGYETPVLDVAGSDYITLILDGIVTLAQLMMKFIDVDCDLLKVQSGTASLDEIVHTVAAGTKVAIRVDVRGLHDLKIAMKGDVAGIIRTIAVRYEGTSTVTPRISD